MAFVSLMGAIHPANAAVLLVRQGLTSDSWGMALGGGIYTFELTAAQPIQIVMGASYDYHVHIYQDGQQVDADQGSGDGVLKSLPSADRVAFTFEVPRAYYDQSGVGGWYSYYHFPASFAMRLGGPAGVPYTLTITGRLVPDQVPEPSVWALMILGFGATGAMLRRANASVPRALRTATAPPAHESARLGVESFPAQEARGSQLFPRMAGNNREQSWKSPHVKA